MVQEKMFAYQGMRVARDVDLAELFDLDVQELREEAKKNMERFPSDFMIRLSDEEYAFSEPGIIMLGGLLKSERAIKVHLQFIGFKLGLAN